MKVVAVEWIGTALVGVWCSLIVIGAAGISQPDLQSAIVGSALGLPMAYGMHRLTSWIADELEGAHD